MSDMFQTMFSKAFPCVENLLSWLKIHWKLYPRVQITTSHYHDQCPFSSSEYATRSRWVNYTCFNDAYICWWTGTLGFITPYPLHVLMCWSTPPSCNPWTACQIRKIQGCACAGNAGNVFPNADFKGNHDLAIPAGITACAVMHVGNANTQWRGKRSRHSRCMHNPQFYVSGKRP